MKTRPSRRRRRGGFTLMEVLLVLAILVILGGTVTYYFVGMQESAYTSAARNQINVFKGNMEVYYLNTNGFPSSSSGLEALRTQPSDIKNPARWNPVVKDPIPMDPWGNPYGYELKSPKEYVIWSYGPDQQDGTDDDIRSDDEEKDK